VNPIVRVPLDVQPGAFDVKTIKDAMEAVGFGGPAYDALPPDLTRAY
jgi:hypothetical protein